MKGSDDSSWVVFDWMVKVHNGYDDVEIVMMKYSMIMNTRIGLAGHQREILARYIQNTINKIKISKVLWCQSYQVQNMNNFFAKKAIIAHKKQNGVLKVSK